MSDRRSGVPGKSHMAVRFRMGIMAALLAGLTGALSLVAVPLPISPVPVTGQTLGVMLSGALLGPLWGAVSVLVYLGLGCLGFPVFAGGGSGPGTFIGPTGGYLAGFVLGAAATGLITRALGAAVARRKPSGATPVRAAVPSWVYLVSTVAGGIGLVHACGSLWLAHVTGRSLGEAFLVGSAPFLPGDALKAVAASLVAARLNGGSTGLLWNRTR